ncbi:hypothetical protein MHBO_000082 [Bonamia ostreae]|uniref:SKP1 component dimerisation domain-containing protein n=1 Tax=Bonamia ostreae TaxID=126728 RepID=A0ABV2AED7_9EUKA
MVLYDNDPPEQICIPVASNNIDENVSKRWESDFIRDQTIEETVQLIKIANFIALRSLQDLACARIATLMIGKSLGQVRSLFNIEKDFDFKEEMELKRQYLWAIYN